MFTKERACHAVVDLNKLEENVKNIRKYIGEDKRIISVIKADAYGHGALKVHERLFKLGIRAYAVAIFEEALEIRKVDKESTVLVLGYVQKELAEEVILNDITVDIQTYEDAEYFSKVAVKLGKQARFAFSIDTGMNRLGYRFNEYGIGQLKKISELDNVIMGEIFTHFTMSDSKDKTFAMKQMERFDGMREALDEADIYFEHYHTTNSGACIDMKDTILDSVRIGLIQFGYYPSDEVVRENISLSPILEWKTKIIALRNISKGETVSYGNTFKADSPMRVATLDIGYADGYNRLLSNKGFVLIKGKKCRILGRICMDLTMVDVTGLDVKISEDVTVLGKDQNECFDADDMAKICETINYEILCDITKRVKRYYI